MPLSKIQWVALLAPTLVACGTDQVRATTPEPTEKPAVAPSAPSGAAPAGKDPSASPEPPAGAAGFHFGMDREEVKAICTNAGAELSGEARRATCSSAPEAVGFETEVELGFCHAKLCTLRLRDSRPANTAKELVDRLQALKSTLVQRYGEPSKTQSETPPRCLEDKVLPCLEDGSMFARYRWRFSSGHRVKLDLVALEGKPVIELRYTVPAGGGAM